MKTITFIVLSIVFVPLCFAGTLIVDINGGGQYTSINLAINNAASGDTVKVWPGTYDEAVVLNKNVILMGSGYETTVITGNHNPTLSIVAGTIQWFMVSSSGGNGINMSGGTVQNCLIIGCSGNGIDYTAATGTGSVLNCTVYQNTGCGVICEGGGTLNVTNCISRANGREGFNKYSGVLNLSYSNGTAYLTNGNVGCVNCDPSFANAPLDFHIAQNTSCGWDSGNPSYLDPDGSPSDMGYYGGPNCPIYPVVYYLSAAPDTSGTIKLKAKARANY